MDKLKIKKEKVVTHNMRKILPLYAKYKGLLSCVMIFIFFAGVLGIAVPILSANSLSNLAQGNFDLAIKFTIAMCAVAIIKVLVNAFDEYFYVKINLKIQYDLTKKTIDAISQTKMKKLDNTQIGFLTERLSTDIGRVSDIYLDMIELVFNILTNVVFLFYIAYLNIWIFFILLVYVVVLYVICTVKSRVWIRGKRKTKKAKDIARSAYYEQVSGMRDIKLLDIKQNVSDYSNEKFKEALKIEENVNAKRNIIRRVQSSVSIIFELIFLLIGISFINSQMLLLAGLLVIYTYYGKVESLVQFLSSFKEYKAEGEISATRIFEIVDEFEKEEYGNEELENFSGNIELKNVNFSYGESKVLNDLSMSFKPGEMTAIVGQSGSGKTTVLNLLSKLYEIDSGEILLDEKDINKLTEKAIRSNIGEISQMPYIFNASIRQNLLFVKPDATDDEIISVLKKAQIYNDIKKLKNGIDSEIGENGIKLSGGQKQRIAIARLLLKNSKVIVFDEATSALDNVSQSKITELLNSLKQEKTIIIVAHRLSTIVEADKIYMLADGNVIANGTHKSLMRNCSEYRELYRLEEKNALNEIDNQE